jgi:hypothetical protein
MLGLRRLGFRVYFYEQLASRNCRDENDRPAAFEESTNLAYFRSVTEAFGFADSAALICDTRQTHGLSFSEMLDVAEEADLLVNIGGHLRVEKLRGRFRRAAYFDDDPGFTQIWQAQGYLGKRLAGHDYWFTVGENVGRKDCPIPTCGIPWQHLPPLVTLDHWPVCLQPDLDRFTTVGTWRGPYGPLEYRGTTYGLKAHELRKVIQLPQLSPSRYEIALDIGPADGHDLQALRSNGWSLVDPKLAAGTPESFRRYVQGSGAEFSVAQQVYVGTWSGWFSDRTVRYLASGKPALVQDTGFSQHYPSGEGLIPFRCLDEAIAGAARLVRDYERHARAARSLAETYFDAARVIGKLLEITSRG